MDSITKKCNSCGETKPIEEFEERKFNSGNIGRRGSCKTCKKSYNSSYPKDNKEKINTKHRQWVSNHAQEQKEYHRNYNKFYTPVYKEKNKEHIRRVRKEYREKNIVKLVSYARENCKKSYQKNKERITKYQKEYIATHSERIKELDKIRRNKYPEKELAKQRNRRAKINGGKITAQDWQSVLDKYGNKCLCCHREDVKLTLDHIIPLISGGKHIIENVQPLCGHCNSSKGTKTIDYRPNFEK